MCACAFLTSDLSLTQMDIKTAKPCGICQSSDIRQTDTWVQLHCGDGHRVHLSCIECKVCKGHGAKIGSPPAAPADAKHLTDARAKTESLVGKFMDAPPYSSAQLDALRQQQNDPLQLAVHPSTPERMVLAVAAATVSSSSSSSKSKAVRG